MTGLIALAKTKVINNYTQSESLRGEEEISIISDIVDLRAK